MKIVIAPDSIKGSLSSLEVAQAIQRGINKINSGIETAMVPMGDGGEGTVQTLVDASVGKINFQTAFGKTPFGVAKVAKQEGITVIAIAGSLGENYQILYRSGFDGIFSIIDQPTTLVDAIGNATELIENAAENIARFWISGKNL